MNKIKWHNLTANIDTDQILCDLVALMAAEYAGKKVNLIHLHPTEFITEGNRLIHVSVSYKNEYGFYQEQQSELLSSI